MGNGGLQCKCHEAGSIRRLAEVFTQLKSWNKMVSMDNGSQKLIKNTLDSRDNNMLAVEALNEYNKLREELQAAKDLIARIKLATDQWDDSICILWLIKEIEVWENA